MDVRDANQSPYREIIEQIGANVRPDHVVLIGIDGRAGAGKTTLAHWLAEHIRKTGTDVATVHLDDFARPAAERVDRSASLAIVPDIDWGRFQHQVITPLRAGKTARFQLYDWPSDRLAAWRTIPLGGVVIVDGVTALRRELREHYDLRIWCECPLDVRKVRVAGRGDTSPAELAHWLPSEDDYVAEHAPAECAHVVID